MRETQLTPRYYAQLQTAIQFHKSGNITTAQKLYTQILATYPEHLECLFLLGSSYLQTRRPDLALPRLASALAINPNSPHAHNNYGIALRELGRQTEAIDSFHAAIKLDPQFSEAYNNLGMTLSGLNRLEEALDSFNDAISIAPNFAKAHKNRGDTLRAIGRLNDALNSYITSHGLNPGDAELLNNYGVTLVALQKREEAIEIFKKARSIDPKNERVLGNLALALRELNRYDDALSINDEIIANNIRNVTAYCERAAIFRELRLFDQAVDNYRTARSLSPRDPSIILNLGVCLRQLGQLRNALECFDKFVELNPSEPVGHFNRATILAELKRFVEARACYENVLELDPTDGLAYSALLQLRGRLCDWTDFQSHLSQLKSAILLKTAVVLPFAVLGLIDSPDIQLAAAQNYSRAKCSLDNSLGPIRLRGNRDRIRVGYFSSDFREHAVSYLLAEFLESHDKANFETYGFSMRRSEDDPTRDRIKASFDDFYDIDNVSDIDAALLSRRLGLDIAVDLNGYTEGCRPKIFALRTAPIQVSYLGYSGTMGTDFTDYLIADHVVIPENQRQWYSEKLVYLPECFIPNDSKRQISDRVFDRLGLGLPVDAFVFCCFNNSYKITPDIFSVWLRILEAVPKSVLWLAEANDNAADALKGAAHNAGVDASRLVFAKKIEKQADHLARLKSADLFLDTIPYNAHTTACDALWAGLPILTYPGHSFASRVAASLLTSLGVNEMICGSLDEYFNLATKFASDHRYAKMIQEKLLSGRLSKGVFRGAITATYIQSAYKEMITRYEAGLPPDDIVLLPSE